MLGCVQKMLSSLESPVQYCLPLNDELVQMNALIGRHVQLQYTGRIFCVHCGKQSKKSFNQGYCYPCFIKLAQCDQCIIKPQLCHYAAGTCREPAWGEAFCFQPHIVYLANSSGLKVGITRQSQLPTRWIDQGAMQALPIFEVASRYQAGLIEVVLAQHVSDKTQWQRMLKSAAEPIDLHRHRDELMSLCAAQLQALNERFPGDIRTLAQEVVEITYPVAVYPEKVKACNLDQNPDIAGVLQGIKGQYLILDCGVVNVRKYGGYEWNLRI
jgi:Protein of unknown function (DUF2797)